MNCNEPITTPSARRLVPAGKADVVEPRGVEVNHPFKAVVEGQAGLEY